MSAITTHVLDIAGGHPAVGLDVRLEFVAAAGNQELARATTDSAGRITSLGPELIDPGIYRLVFDTGAYLARRREASGNGANTASFFPEVTITFAVADGREHYHVPLLLSPFGYSTYRGT